MLNKIRHQTQQTLFILLAIAIPVSIAAANIILGSLIFCWIIEGKFSAKVRAIISSKWMLSIFLFIALYFIAMFWGESHDNALWQFQRLALLLAFPILATIELNQKTFKRAIFSFLCVNFISAILAILINNSVIHDLGTYIYFINSDWETAAFIKYNYHNVLLALSFCLALYIVLEVETRYKWLFILFIIAYSISIFTERGRAGQVLFNLFSLFYIIYYNRNQIIRLALLIIILFSFQFLVYKTTKVYKDRFDAVSNIIKNNGSKGEGKTDDIRYVFVRETIKRIVKKPVFGYGTGSFGTIFKNEVSTGHTFNSKTTPHNQYLDVWFELGFLGLILLLMISSFGMDQHI